MTEEVPPTAAGPDALPEDGAADAPTLFQVLCGSLGAQVQMALGLIPDPVEKKPRVELGAARQGIQLLTTLQEKTRGNLTQREETMLGDLLAYVRLLYVERVKQLDAKGDEEGGVPGGADASETPQGAEGDEAKGTGGDG